MKKKKTNTEQYDLFNLIHSMSNSEKRAFRGYIKRYKTDKGTAYLNLFEEILKQKQYDEEELIKKLGLNRSKFRDTKFYLFKILLESLKHGNEDDFYIQLHQDLIELRILTKKGFVKKAKKKFKKIKELSEEIEEYNILIPAYKTMVQLIPFEFPSTEIAAQKAKVYKEKRHYLELIANVDEYIQLEDQILGHIWRINDSRVKEKGLILDLLKHPLLVNEHKAKSERAKFFYFEIISLIYSGINDYKNAAYYAKKCLEHCLRVGIKPTYFEPIISAYHNYIYYSLWNGNTAIYERESVLYDEVLAKISVKGNLVVKARIFEYRTDILLEYLWRKKDYKEFQKTTKKLFEDYEKYKQLLTADFHPEILLGISRLYFSAGQVEKALEWINRMLDIQRKNPTNVMLIAGNIMRIMIYYEIGNVKTIPHLVSNVEYFAKSRNHYFQTEQTFLRGMNKIRAFHSKREKRTQFQELHKELQLTLSDQYEQEFSDRIRLAEWVKSKC